MNKIQKLKIQLEKSQTLLKSTIDFEDKMKIQEKIMSLYEDISHAQTKDINRKAKDTVKQNKVIHKEKKNISKGLDTQTKGYIKNFKNIEQQIQ